MKKDIKIVTDGSCDFPQEILDRIDVDIVSLNVSFEDETFVAGVEIDDTAFYEKMRKSPKLPHTSSPSPDRFMETFRNENHEELLVITLSEKLSSTYSNAVLAKQLFEEEDDSKRIEVVDCKTGSVAAALIVLKCSEMIQEGKSLDEILVELERMKEHVVLYGVLDTIENAVKGGRINPIAGQLINVLNYKVLVKVEDGLVKPFDKARGDVNSIKKLMSHVGKAIGDSTSRRIAIAHSNCPEKVERVKKYIEEQFKVKETFVTKIGPIMGTYAAERAILISIL
ncbi:MAG: DegV family protein [Clostridioides sp.]|nr:DegV family protein [Clostridioides sp.]